MIKVNIKTTELKRQVVVDETVATPRSVFDENGLTIDGKQVSLSGAKLTDDKFNKTFSQLGIEADKEITLNAVVKSDGARC